LKFYLDATVNDQTRAQQSSRAFFSGTGSNAAVDNTTNTEFETVDLGTIDGPNGPLVLGPVQAVLRGVVGAGDWNGRLDPNLRVSGNTGSRETDSNVFALGSVWTRDRWEVRGEAAYSSSDTLYPNLSTQLDFINPRGPQPAIGQSIDNGIPAIFDASGGILQFGIAPGLPETPTTAELLDPANYALRSVSQGQSTNENTETALRLDTIYDTDMRVFTSFEAGIRWNKNTAENNDVTDVRNFTNSTSSFYRPTADLFSGIVVPGQDNFNAADNRTLYISDYLIIDNALSYGNPDAVIDALNAAIVASNEANGVDYPLLDVPSTQLAAYFDIKETTTAAYLQGNYEFDAFNVPWRGNIGVRYVSTDLTSTGYNIVDDGDSTIVKSEGSYSLWLPRFNMVVDATDNLLFRFGVAKDLRRPNFDDLSTSIAFPGGASASVRVGNPNLQPESVWSYDLAGEFYFSETGFLSLGFFHKVRTNLFATATEFPAEPTGPDGQIERDITPPCEEGGIYNPVANRNVWSSQSGVGICVPLSSTFNVDGETTQTGVEFAFQYDLSAFEDRMGWWSGFGIFGNYTYQKAGGSAKEYRPANGDANALNDVLGRTDTDQSTPTLDDDVVEERITLMDMSENAYNVTLFYDKYGWNFRARYSWRSHYQTNSFVSFNMPRIVDDRGQLNASISYMFNDNWTVGLEGINLTRADAPEWCVNDNALLCAQGLTDRRIIAGVTFRF
jgi:iron complex outermembrane receptor protein